MIYGYIKNVPSGGGGGGGDSLNYNVLKTGATTGVDGDLQMGYGVNTTTLDADNPFGNARRFTDLEGGINYSSHDNIVIDWSTYRESSGEFLMYLKTPIGQGTADYCYGLVDSLTNGGFTDWKPSNATQVYNLFNWVGSIYASSHWHPPFNDGYPDGFVGVGVVSCTDSPYNASNLIGIENTNVPHVNTSKTYIYCNMVAVRVGNVSELSL